MKNVLLVLSLFLFVLSGCESSGSSEIIEVNGNKYKKEQDKYYFRETVWGMSKEDVIKQERENPDVETRDEILYLNREVAGFKASVMYFLGDEGLHSASYLLTEKHNIKNDYIEDYKKLKGKLIEKYGEPSSSEEKWLEGTDFYQQDAENYSGMAISEGKLTYRDKWESKDTKITLSIKGENFNITTLLSYKDIQKSNSLDKEGL